MEASNEIDVGEVIDLSKEVVGLERRSGRARLMLQGDHGPPRIDGYTVGAPFMTENAPHDGEVHPDADELLIVISGGVDVRLELEDEERIVRVGPGHGVVVPRGVWHRVVLKEPTQLVHITPGPGGDHRPMQEP